MNKYKLWKSIEVKEIIRGKWIWKKEKLKKPMKWIITWIRTLYLWFTECDETCYFVKVWCVKAIQVTFDLYKNPVYVEVERKKIDWFNFKWLNYKFYWLENN